MRVCIFLPDFCFIVDKLTTISRIIKNSVIISKIVVSSDDLSSGKTIYTEKIKAETKIMIKLIKLNMLEADKGS